ncbi:hypothetical protein [Sphingobacterium psychroaquaticum]|uniref:Terminase-like family protein n=1 Tax=Sphingobacterium psychroaquaticum TaxID=561061 RepID=A0A1X7K3J3_9SPHI|nr:hypothetical protein [Sphingobacterium psychroaquaticum]SMG35539.1 hypothetical protein SAMN05660862_2528 [Sphingobacterium psychroaquaticum]
MASYTDKKYLEDWQEFSENINRATPIDLAESPLDKKKRIERLEKDDEAWFEYYFPTFYTSKPADFQTKSTRYVMSNDELYLVRSWARELAKSARTMMETMKRILTKRNRNLLMVSDSKDNATRLLLPYKVNLESNNRIINDYGKQQSIGNWEAHEFKTKKGASFRALGAGQSPRGTRNDAVRPDIILIDDIDTDQDCRNKDIIKDRFEWIESALIPTRSISKPLLLIACGNIIAKYCCITEMAKKADRHEIVNIRDSQGKSTWPSKNTEEMIDRVLKTIGHTARQREYFNDPIIEGTTFTSVKYAKAPLLRTCEMVVVYADPSTSNKDKQKGKASAQRSYKSVQVIGYKNHQYFTYWIRLQQVGNKTFVNWLYDSYAFCKRQGVDTVNIWIENNSLQDPHYEQVISPQIKLKAEEDCIDQIPVRKDTRNKPEKFERVDGTLQPIDEAGNLLFDEKLKGTEDMDTMESQMLSVSPDCKIMDGPDCNEGGTWIIQNRKVVRSNNRHASGKRSSHKY